MEKEDRSALLVMHNYNDYANQLLLETASKMSEEEFTRECSPSHGTVKGLILHIILCEYGFVLRCEGIPVSSVTDDFDTYTFPQIRALYAKVAEMRKDYLDIVNENELNEVIPVKFGEHSLNLSRWQMLFHALNHSTLHRGELSIVMTSLGYPLPTMDMILKFVTDSGQKWPWG